MTCCFGHLCIACSLVFCILAIVLTILHQEALQVLKCDLF
jgi:hypothetical protein